MDLKKEIANLNKLRNSILNITTSKKKELMIDNYLNLLEYLSELKDVDTDYYITEISSELDKYDEHYFKNKEKYIQQYYDNLDMISMIFKVLIKDFDNKMIPKFEKIKQSIDLNQAIKLLSDYFRQLDPILCSVFETSLQGDYKSDVKGITKEYDGLCFDTAYLDFPRMVVYSDENNFNLNVFCHELGHAYDFYLNSFKGASTSQFLVEVPSIFLENLCNDFFKNIPEYYQYAMNNKLEKNVSVYHQMILGNLIARFWKRNLLYKNEEENFCIDKSLVKLLSHKEIKSLEYFPLNLDNYLYPLSNIIANDLFNTYKGNHQEGFKKFRDFIMMRECYTLKEILENYATNLAPSQKEMTEVGNYQKKLYHL